MAGAFGVASLLGGILLGACSVVGVRSGTEEPAFSVTERIGGIEIRHYAPRSAADTTIEAGEMEARSEGFRRLAGYIFGRNSASSRLAMTAPVGQFVNLPIAAPVSQTSSTIRFFLPATITTETAPTPLDKRVRLVMVPGETVAVLRFSGSTSPEAVAAQQAALLSQIKGSGWTAEGAPFVWFYDPPWTLPPFRRSEAVVTVHR